MCFVDARQHWEIFCPLFLQVIQETLRVKPVVMVYGDKQFNSIKVFVKPNEEVMYRSVMSRSKQNLLSNMSVVLRRQDLRVTDSVSP